jgi:peptidoglycan hydrolase-like protein with peptidoglycan-binding domain
VKNRLKFLGYYTGTVNNTFDAATTTAVKALQKDSGITGDGSVGNMTKSKLNRPKGKLK